MWNCEGMDANGERLLNELEEEDFYVINHDTKTWIGEVGQRDSSLDLIIGNATVLNLVSYSQEDDTWGSDHFPIRFSCVIDPKIYRKMTNGLSTKKTDWTVFTSIIKDKEAMLSSPEYADMSEECKYKEIINKIKEATFEASGKKFKYMDGKVVRDFNTGGGSRPSNLARFKRNPVEWWDSECSRVIEDRKKALTIYNRDKNLVNKIELKKYDAIARRTITRKKRESFRSFAANLDRFVSIGYVWNRLNIFKNRDNKKSRHLDNESELITVACNERDKMTPCWTEEKPFK